MSRCRQARSAIAALWLILASSAAFADPRWWWSDIRLTNTATMSATPHIIAPGYATGGAGGQALFIVWAEVDATQGDTEIWAVASFNQGCSFCQPTRLTDNAVDDTDPRIAVLALPTGFWSFAVIFEQAGGPAVIAWDSNTVSYRVPSDQLCPQFEQLGPLIVTNAQYVSFGGIDAFAESPDISAAGTPTFGHFHATWSEMQLAGNRVIQYAHDLTARGGPGWTLDPIKTLQPRSGLTFLLGEPRIAADLATDPDPVSGNNTGDRSAVNVVFVEVDAVGPTDRGTLVGLRSIDSGQTFSPNGVRIDAPASVVSDGAIGTDAVSRPALDAAFSTFTTTDPAWVATAWDDRRSGGRVPDIDCDARFLEEPVLPNPDWQVPDELVSSTTAQADGRPSIALQHQFGTMPTPAWVAWHDERFGASEIVYRGGVLDASAPDIIDFSRFPFPPVRALDPATSQDFQLSHCSFDPSTFACLPDRGAGDALDVSLDGNEFALYAVWSDSRFGQREVFFKRTDRYVSGQAPRLTTACDGVGGAFVDVDFDIVPSCPQLFANERMARYLIYYGTNPGGPYLNAGSPIEILVQDAPGPTVTRRITGLLPGASYQVIVVPEDEARNVYPSTFDPLADAASAHSNEAAVTTPDPCVAPPVCLWRSDVTVLWPHAPSRAAVYLVPPSVDDISLQGAAYRCPFASGELEPDANALGNRVPLVLYQVSRPLGTLALAKSGTTIRFTF